MARQNSKYFSSVIEKLIADKHKENIAVDESFKLSLRGKVMERAAMMPRMEALDSAETGGFAGFVNRWKYALALVPSALLVMVVASQVMNMPVGVESEVVTLQSGVQSETRTLVLQNEGQEESHTLVLQGGVQEESHTSEELRTSEAENSNAGVVDTKKIKTFPGALVMPVGDAVEQGGALTTLQSATGTSVLQNEGQKDTRTSEELRTSEAENNNAGELRAFEVESSNVGVVRTPYSSVVPDRTGSLDTNNYYESGSGVTSYERTDTSVRNDESLVVADRGDSLVAAPIGDGMGGGSDDSFVPTNDYATRNLVNPSLAVPLVMKNAELSAYNVTYETSLSGTEKSALENNVIVPLTEGRDVQRVVVGSDANGYVLVTVFYGDGSSVSKTYSYNSSGNVWDTVTYVQPVTQTSGLTYKIYKINY